MIFSHKDTYNFIYSKFHAKFGTVKANKLNHADRLQYIKYVLSSILIYYMSTVLFLNLLFLRLMPSLGISGGLGSKIKILLILLLFILGMIFVNP
jgi:hypothetical protein